MATLLLADDSVTIQRVIELTFADEGVRVIAVGDGASAIARFDEERPDIVLADVGMAGVDGYQVAAHVKQAKESQAPVLLLTGAFEPIDENRARASGCDGVLVKPFEPRQLIKTVHGLLSGERPAGLWPADMPRLETGSDAVPAPASPPAVPASEEVSPPSVDDVSPGRAPVAAAAPVAARQMPLASVFSAMLAAERRNAGTPGTAPLLTEAAVEEVIQRVLRRMMDEKVRKIVLETAERLIREEIDRIRA